MIELDGKDVAIELQVLCPVDDCILEIDVWLKSSDGIVFGAHKRNLELYSDGFPFVASTTTVEEVATLPEEADVLRLMLKFMHNVRQPDLNEIGFSILSVLAEAVEKYMIFSAMGVCKMQMALEVEDYPLAVLMYSVKHDYPKLANKAALLSVGTSSMTFAEEAKKFGLSENHAYHWFRYRDRWTTALTRSTLDEVPPVMHKGGFPSCSDWEPFHSKVVRQVGRNFSNLARFDYIVDCHSSGLDECRNCRIRSENWKRRVANELAAIPEFTGV